MHVCEGEKSGIEEKMGRGEEWRGVKRKRCPHKAGRSRISNEEASSIRAMKGTPVLDFNYFKSPLKSSFLVAFYAQGCKFSPIPANNLS